jgi:hypothetical protein
MSENYPTRSAVPGKPARPFPELPLFAYAAGVWARKIWLWPTGTRLRWLVTWGRKGLVFSTLRHVHRTVADVVKDQPAADLTAKNPPLQRPPRRIGSAAT